MDLALLLSSSSKKKKILEAVGALISKIKEGQHMLADLLFSEAAWIKAQAWTA